MSRSFSGGPETFNVEFSEGVDGCGGGMKLSLTDTLLETLGGHMDVSAYESGACLAGTT